MLGRFGAHVGMFVEFWAPSSSKMVKMQKRPPLTQFWQFFRALRGCLGGHLGHSWGFIASYWVHLAPTWSHFERHPKLLLEPWARFCIKLQKCKNKHPSHSFGVFLNYLTRVWVHSGRCRRPFFLKVEVQDALWSLCWALLALQAAIFEQSCAPSRVWEPMLSHLDAFSRHSESNLAWFWCFFFENYVILFVHTYMYIYIYIYICM